MQELRCPHCGKVFTVDESEYAQLLKQVEDESFHEKLEEKAKELEGRAALEQEIAVNKAVDSLKDELHKKETKINELNDKLASLKKDADYDKVVATNDLNNKIIKLNNDLELQKTQYEKILKDKEKYYLEELEMAKDFKLKLSTKMIGESLEQHCLNEFNSLRATGFKNAYFEKDNEVVNNSKGDFIFRDYTDDKVEYISIMFDMKNESDTTASKQKNEHFFEKLDKDRKNKNCEYAILVSMLEPDNDLYNNGIVDVSYKYEKMYVVRPQFFIPIISILRNAALDSINSKRELEIAKNQNIDITHFEESLNEFKDKFAINIKRAQDRFDDTIKEIDNAIEQLQKAKENLLKTGTNLTIANNKLEDVSIKKLTKDNPTMKEKFEELKKNQ